LKTRSTILTGLRGIWGSRLEPRAFDQRSFLQWQIA